MAERKRRVRRAGSRWRLLVHEIRGRRRDGTAYHVQSDPEDEVPRPVGFTDAEYAKFRDHVNADRQATVEKGWASYHVLEGTEFDELVVGEWIHLEQMDLGYWWMNVGGVTVHVRADRDGRPERVTVHGPGDYDDPVEGCEYALCWRADSPDPEHDEANGGSHG